MLLARIARYLLLAILPGLTLAADDAPLRFGVFPRWNAQIMVADFTPLAQALGKALNRKVQIETDKDFASLMRRVYAREFDLIHVNQLQYLQAHDQAGYQVIAKLCETADCTIRAVIVTRTYDALHSAAERILDYPRDAVVGRQADAIYCDLTLRDRLYAMVHAGQPVQGAETQLQRRDGSRVDVELTMSPLRDTQGELIGTVCIGRDVTHAKALRRELIQAEKLASVACS